MIVHMLPTMVCIFLFPSLSLPSNYLLAFSAGEDGSSDSQLISDLHAYAFNKLIFHNPKKKRKTCFCHSVLVENTA